MHEEGDHVHNSSMHASMHSLLGHQALASHCSSCTPTHKNHWHPITLPPPCTLTLSLHLSLTSMASSKSLKYTKANPLERPVCRSGRQSLNTQTAMTCYTVQRPTHLPLVVAQLGRMTTALTSAALQHSAGLACSSAGQGLVLLGHSRPLCHGRSQFYTDTTDLLAAA